MRIFHGITRLGGGGAERQLRNLVCCSQCPEIQHSVFTLQPGGFEADLIGAGCSLYVRPFPRWKLPIALKSLIDQIRADKADIIQSWDPQFDVLCGLAALFTRIPFIASERNSALQYQLAEGYGKAWFRRFRGPVIRRAARLIVANSRCGLKYVQSISGDKVAGKVIRNGLDIEQLQEISRQPIQALPNVERFLIVVNRLSATKRTDAILQAFDALPATLNSYHLVVLGTGPDEERLQGITASLKSGERIHFLGHRHDVAAYVARASAFVSASSVEGMPNSILESMIIGTPCIASNIDAHTELLEDSDGGIVLFDAGDIPSLTQAMETMLTDEARRAQIIAKASEFAHRFSIERMVEQFKLCYQEILP